ncbi:unnamed protein product [Wickerhamomyces anomalus]
MVLHDEYKGSLNSPAPSSSEDTNQRAVANLDDPSKIYSFMGQSGKTLSWFVSVIAGVGFLLFGYDQGVMGSLLTQDTFRHTFPEIDTVDDGSKSTYQGFVVAVYEVGCLVGALFTMWYGDKVGRRKTIFTGCCVMIVGAIIQAAAYSTGQLIAGRIIAGLGNGMNTSTVPVWQSECAKPDQRGKLVMIQGSLIACGIMISYWIDFAFYFIHWSSASWRFPIAFQIIFPVIIVPVILKLPESPRWLLKVGKVQDAIKVFSALEGVPANDPYVQRELEEVETAIAKEETGPNVTTKRKFRELFRQGPQRNFHRVCLAFWNQVFQQITGINLITYYAGTIFQQYIGMSPLNSRILAACNGTEYFMASWLAFFTIEHFGRRKLMIFGALGQAFTMAILTGTNWAADPANKDNSGAGIAAAVFLFVFNSFFAVGWLGMTWLYPAEITPLSIRGMTNGLSTAANWAFNFMVVMITPVAFENIGAYTYTIFAAINLCLVPAVFFLYPETSGRTLEEMDVIFEMSDPWKPWEAVHNANTLPHEYKNGQFMDVEKAEASHTENVGVFQENHSSV